MPEYPYPLLVNKESVIYARGEQQKSTCNEESGGSLVNNGILIGVSRFVSASGYHLDHSEGLTRISSYLK